MALADLTDEQLRQRLEQTKRAVKLADSLSEMAAIRLFWVMIESELKRRK